MQRAAFHKSCRWLPGFLLFLVVNLLLLGSLQKRGLPLGFIEDQAYLDLSVAAMAGEHGVSEHALSPVHALWQGALMLLYPLFGNLVALTYALNFILALGIMVVTLRIARLWFLFQPYLLASSLLLALFPALLFTAISGTPLALATLLVLLATRFHLEGIMVRRAILPLSAALCIGLSALIQIEFILIWVVFALHAFLIACLRKKWIGFTLLQGFIGLAICFIFIWPLIDFNVRNYSVGWPIALDAGLLTGKGLQLGRAYAATLSSDPAGFGIIDWVLILPSAVLLMLSSVKRPEERPFLLLLALPILLPAFYAAATLFLGWSGHSYIFAVFRPLYLLLMVYGVFRLPFVIDAWLPHRLPVKPKSVMVAIWSFGLVLFAGIMLLHQRSYQQQFMASFAFQQDKRSDFLALLDDPGFENAFIATDQLGYLSYRTNEAVIDLSGSRSLDVLRTVGADGSVEPERFVRLLQTKRPDVLIIWDIRNEPLVQIVRERLGDKVTEHPSFLGGPTILKLGW